MRTPLCFLCLKPVETSPPIYINGERRYAHQECMSKRLPSTPIERDINPRKEKGEPVPRAEKIYVEEYNGERFVVTVLPEVKPDPKRTKKTIFRLPPGDTGRERRKA